MRTVSIEPEPLHSRFLLRNEHIYGKVLPIALSNSSGELPLYYDADNPGGTSLCWMPGYVQGEGTVPVRTFAEIAASGVFGSLDDVQLIKIDVEGAEVEAIEGMSDVFANRNFRPDIWCEVRGDTAGRAPGSYRKVRELLARHGYIAHDLKNGCDQPLDEHDLSTRVVYDLLFTVPDRR